MIIIRICLLIVFLFLVPVMLGAPFTKVLPNNNRYRLYACFPIGVFVELAMFQLLAVPVGLLRLPFTLLCWIFGIVVAVSCVYSGIMIRREKPFTLEIPALNRWEAFYFIVFLGLLGWQLFKGFTGDTTVRSYDDAAYVTYAADAIRFNAIQTINPYTGIATRISVTRVLQGWLYFPAFLSLLSSVPVAVMERTVLETFDIILAYAVFAYMARVVIKRRDNCLIFLIILSVLHIYGWYSPYSVTFRLLGPNYQGKAILAASFFPLVFTLFIQILEKPYSRSTGFLLMLLSAAASSLTMFGVVTVILNTTLVTGVSLFRKKRQWKHLYYIIWSVALPIIYLGIYFISKYGEH